jgi:hypothetical protein
LLAIVLLCCASNFADNYLDHTSLHVDASKPHMNPAFAAHIRYVPDSCISIGSWCWMGSTLFTGQLSALAMFSVYVGGLLGSICPHVLKCSPCGSVSWTLITLCGMQAQDLTPRTLFNPLQQQIPSNHHEYQALEGMGILNKAYSQFMHVLPANIICIHVQRVMVDMVRLLHYLNINLVLYFKQCCC